MSDDFSSDVNTTGTIAPGGSASGVLETAYDSDWFKVSLVAGETYQFELSPVGGTWGGLSSPVFGISTGNNQGLGVTATQVDNGVAPAIWVRPDASGVYYLSVQGFSATGAYNLKARAIAPDDYADNASTAATLAIGGSVSGQLEVAGDHDAFKIALEAGKTYTLAATGGNSVTSLPLVGFYSSNTYNNALSLANSYVSDGGTVSFTPTTSGTYYAVASALDPLHGVGAYQVSLNLAADDYAANIAGAGVLKMGTTVQGKIDVAHDIDWLKISLDANQSYTFLLSDPSNHANITIVNEQGQAFSAAAASLAGTGEVLTLTPPRAGDYFVQVTGEPSYVASKWTGSYSVSAAPTQADDFSDSSNTTGLLGINQTIKGHIETASDIDWIKVQLTAGAAYAFDLSPATYPDGSSHAFNYFSLMNSVQQIAYVTTGASSDLLITYTAASSGDYFLAIYGNNSPLSSYSITSYGAVADDIAGDASTKATLVEGSVLHSTINAPLDRDWYKVELKANQYYVFAVDAVASHEGTLGSVGGNATIKLIDSNGQVVSSYSGNSSYDPTLSYFSSSVGGTYYIEVAASALATGSYTLKESLGGVLPDTTPPTANSVSGPTAPGALNANILVGFNESAHLGSGTITLSTAAGALVETFDAASSTHLSISGYQQIGIDPTADLLPSTDYVLQFGIGSVKDTAGNANTVVIKETFHTADAVQHVIGGAGNDVFHAGNSGGSYDGGAGLDTLIVPGLSYSYYVGQTPLTITLTNSGTGNDVETLTSIERVQFSNATVLAFDITGNAGEVYRLYQAAFGRTPDTSGLGYWISQADKGLSQHDIANSFVSSAEFVKLYGAASSDSAFLTALYQNVLHRAPDQGGQDYWIGQMQHGMAHADVLTAFSESPENQIATFSAIHTGISYTPY